MTYEEAVDFLYSQLPMFQREGAKALPTYDLQKMEALMARMGHPERDFRTVHIAGTNGKGSSAHMLASILQAAGYRVGLYTSPHLRTFTERIRVDGQKIPRKEVAQFVTHWQTAIEEVQPSFFEMSVALAFDYFRKTQPEIAIIETGMGGRRDATNVITPLVSLITNISEDHLPYIGPTLTDIAKHKAGIIKPGIPVVMGEPQPEFLEVFKAEAMAAPAPLTASTDFWSITVDEQNIGTIYQEGEEWMTDVSLDLKGSYQWRNVPGVLEVLAVLENNDFFAAPEAIRIGLSQVIKTTGLKGRWQVLGTKPLTVADTGHNEAGLGVILAELEKLTFETLHWVWGMVNDKEVSATLQRLPKQAQYYFCKPDIPRGLSETDLAQRANQLGLVGEAHATVAAALAAAREQAAPEDIIMIGGSTFVVAELEEL